MLLWWLWHVHIPADVAAWCVSKDEAVGCSGWNRTWHTDSSGPSEDRRMTAWPHTLDLNLSQTHKHIKMAQSLIFRRCTKLPILDLHFKERTQSHFLSVHISFSSLHIWDLFNLREHIYSVSHSMQGHYVSQSSENVFPSHHHLPQTSTCQPRRRTQ